MTSEGPARYGVVNPSLRSSGVRHPAWDILLQQPKLTLPPGAEWQRGRGTDQCWPTEESDDVDTLILGTPALGHHPVFLVLVLCWQSTFQGSHSPLISQSLAILFLFISEPLTGMFSHLPPAQKVFPSSSQKARRTVLRSHPTAEAPCAQLWKCTCRHSGGFWKIWAADSTHPYLEKSVRKLSSAGKNTPKSSRGIILRHTGLMKSTTTGTYSQWPNPEEVRRDRQGQWPHKVHGWTRTTQ